jgi:hypothetical protein
MRGSKWNNHIRRNRRRRESCEVNWYYQEHRHNISNMILQYNTLQHGTVKFITVN